MNRVSLGAQKKGLGKTPEPLCSTSQFLYRFFWPISEIFL